MLLGSGIRGLKTVVEFTPAMKKQPTQRRCPLQWQSHVAGGRYERGGRRSTSHACLLFCCHGRREHWLSLDPRALREWLMTPMAITLGLSPTDPAEAARIPKRGTVAQWLTPDKSLPSNCIYVGRGHHSHRLPTTKWKSPFIPGHDCSDEEWVTQYVAHICSSADLWNDLPSLSNQVLVCDCPWQSLCEADLLAGLVFEATAPEPSPLVQGARSHHRARSAKELVTAVATSRVVTVASCPIPPQPFSQEAIRLAFQKLFPEAWLANTPFPMVEDLVNAPPFNCYTDWRYQQGMEWDGPLKPYDGPHVSENGSTHSRRKTSRCHFSENCNATPAPLWPRT